MAYIRIIHCRSKFYLKNSPLTPGFTKLLFKFAQRKLYKSQFAPNCSAVRKLRNEEIGVCASGRPRDPGHQRYVPINTYRHLLWPNFAYYWISCSSRNDLLRTGQLSRSQIRYCTTNHLVMMQSESINNTTGYGGISGRRRKYSYLSKHLEGKRAYT